MILSIKGEKIGARESFSTRQTYVHHTHLAQPSLEYPGVAYLGRSIYTTFGLEGINDGSGNTSRQTFLGALLD
jgi:hypothetical protein